MPKQSKKHGLSHADFELMANSRFRRERGTYFALSHGSIPGPQEGCPRVACVVSKKVAARAVDRNLIKRRCRDAARRLIADIKEPLALVFYANRNAKDASYEEIEKDMSKLVQKLMAR